jgi:thymidylate synthase
MRTDTVIATDLQDAWFQCIYRILERGRIYTIDNGSFEGSKRLEFECVTVRVKYPEARPLLPQIPPGFCIPNPVEDNYLDDYLPYLMTDKIEDNELYTYGSRLHGQIEKVIKMYCKKGFNTNQACMEVGSSKDLNLSDPACLRLIDTRVSDGKLHFFVYFRSWSLWGGFPANLGALQLLKEYMASEIDIKPGETIAFSKGLHLYDYEWDLAKIVRGNNV